MFSHAGEYGTTKYLRGGKRQGTNHAVICKAVIGKNDIFVRLIPQEKNETT